MSQDWTPTTRGLDPVRWIRLPYAAGQSAQLLVSPWVANELGIPTHAVRIWRNPYGRPFLHSQHGDYDISWSHSGDGLLVALGWRVRIGVDLERAHPRLRAAELARRFFAPEEADWLIALPPAQCQAMFVRVWCAKEAVLKAHGRGIAFGLHRLQFALADDTLFLRECDPALGNANDWCVYETLPQPGERAVLAWNAAGFARGGDNADP